MFIDFSMIFLYALIIIFIAYRFYLHPNILCFFGFHDWKNEYFNEYFGYYSHNEKISKRCLRTGCASYYIRTTIDRWDFIPNYRGQ